MRRLCSALLFASLVVASAAAQDAASENDCAERFKTADTNSDLVLTPTEIPKAKMLPPTLVKEVLISRKEYIDACMKLVAAQKSEQNPGQSSVPDTKGQQQPQGETGPLNTKTGGAPPESPQGQTPPGMQAAPEGSGKRITEPPK